MVFLNTHHSNLNSHSGGYANNDIDLENDIPHVKHNDDIDFYNMDEKFVVVVVVIVVCFYDDYPKMMMLMMMMMMMMGRRLTIVVPRKTP
jgi:hypothetical protein